MGVFDTPEFVRKLAAYLAANAIGGALEYANTPRAMWNGHADENYATDPYSVVMPFLGSIQWVPAAKISVQVMTTAVKPMDGLARAQAILGAMLDTRGRPKRMIDLTGGYTMLGVNPSTPQIVGVQDNNRYKISLNLDIVAVNAA